MPMNAQVLKQTTATRAPFVITQRVLMLVVVWKGTAVMEGTVQVKMVAEGLILKVTQYT